MRPGGEADERLTVELERLTLRALRATYEDINGSYFGGSLKLPVFELTAADSRLGRWVRELRTLEVSKHLLLDHGWGVLVEVLKHEMAHQFVHEVLQVLDEAAHGPVFRRVCQERGFDARAAGIPSAASEGGGEQARVLDRVAKLLALAESANVHEAQSAMNAAQRLMLKYNIDAVGQSGARGYVFRHLGTPTGRVGESQRILAVILGDHFFVQPIWIPVWRPLEGKRGSVLEICGTPENVAMAEYVHAFLLRTSEQLWRDHKRKLGLRRDAERRTFLAGVMAGFRDRLRSEQRRNEEQGLVWVGDSDLDGYFRTRHPHVRWARYAGSARTETYAHGREAGQRIVLHRGIEQSSTGQRALLPSGRRS